MSHGPENVFKTLATRITARERSHRETERWAWERHDYMTAIRVRGLADGLEEARDILLQVIAESGAAGVSTPLDGMKTAVNHSPSEATRRQ